jgi:hypothetical protein
MMAYGDQKTSGYGAILSNGTRDYNRHDRIGSVIVTKKYLIPGKIYMRCIFPEYKGVCSAIWTFHYEDFFPGDYRWDSILAEGIHESGDRTNGLYLIRDEEISIKTPTVLKTDQASVLPTYKNARFKTSIGELKNNVPEDDATYWIEYEDKWVNHKKTLNNLEEHKILIDWKTDPASVDFYIDDILVNSNTSHVPDIASRLWVGLWFPTDDPFTEATAPWMYQKFKINRFTYMPYVDQPYRHIGETYTNIPVRPLTKKHFETI